MSGFSNSIVGGVGALIRAYIRSPNYVTGVSGWTINRDGSAEFNNLVVRGTINLVPIAQGTPGNIYWTDGYPNYAQIYEDTILHALVLRGPYHNALPNSQIMIWPETSYNGAVAISSWANGTANQWSDVRIDNDGIHVNPAGMGSGLAGGAIKIGYQGVGASAPTLEISTSGTIQLGPGAVGKYYFEEVTRSGQAIANNAIVGLTAFSASQLKSDYGSAWNLAAGVWTCPESSPYRIQFAINYTAGFGAAGRHFVLISNGTSGLRLATLDVNAPAGASDGTASFYGWINKNDQLTFVVLQASGGALTTGNATRVSIGRDL